MRHGGNASHTALAENSPRPRRGREITHSLTCISPWFIFCRWLSGRKSRVSSQKIPERNRGKMKIDGNLDLESTEEFSVEIGTVASCNNGFGFGIIYLVRDELNKMVELRKRIESLLQNFQTEIDNRDDRQPCSPSRSSISSTFAKASVRDFLCDEEHDSRQCSSPDDVGQPEIGFSYDGFKGEKSFIMDELEAEVVAEFDRLQMDGKFLYPEVNLEHNASELSVNMNHEFSNSDFCGVSPRVLERKLHEVVESRQQARISELESALDCALQQLQAKQIELSRWKDALWLRPSYFR